MQNISYSLQALCHRRDEFRVVMSSVDKSFIFPQYIIKNNKLPNEIFGYSINWVSYGSFLFFDYLLLNEIWRRYFTRLPSLSSGRGSGMGWVGVSVTAGSNLIITLRFCCCHIAFRFFTLVTHVIFWSVCCLEDEDDCY